MSNETNYLKLNKPKLEDHIGLTIPELTKNFEKIDKKSKLVDERLDQTEIDLINDTSSSNSYWKSIPIMPSAKLGENGIPNTYDPDANLTALLDPLIDNKYVTKQSRGKDQSSQYDIWQYTFSPKKYDKTVLITACLHGNEYTSFYSLVQFLQLLCTDWNKHAPLSDIRKNTRLVVIPIVNPWGFANNSRQNYRRVDLNRNFNYNWSSYHATNVGHVFYKGVSANSEKETQIMNTFFAEYSDAVALLDFHTIISQKGEYIFFYPRFTMQENNIFAELIREFKRDGERIIWGSSSLPSLTNYASHNFGFNAYLPELNDGIVGENRSSEEMTRALRWFGNCIVAACQGLKSKGKTEALKDPFVKVYDFDNRRGGSAVVSLATNNDYVGFLMSDQRYDVYCNGIVEVSGTVTFEINEDATVGIVPLLWQNFAPYFSKSLTENRRNFEIRRFYKAGVHTIPLSACILTQVTNITDVEVNRTGQVGFRLETWKTNGRLEILSYKPIVKFTPSSAGTRFELYESTNAGNQGGDTLNLRYPNISADNEDMD